ncbi:sulfurtransferase complex subunit TusD [Oceanobacter mangrovi]|uniref:sulfurtransferase complex subunit TusD n=1 Tax=Oceanobacter mangrovi TaxID=2862510 RepID=UPI001C8EF05A|nr:sulfurtransferase complex subunit TusD [Oceanobacter mangrovi]
MASFSILLTRSPFIGESHLLAQEFVTAVLEAGHAIDRVFFYQDAVLVANNRIQPPQGQQSIGVAWQQLASEGGFPLQLCIANAIRRGMANEQESNRYQLDGPTILAGFELTGLGEMAMATSQSDRLVEF